MKKILLLIPALLLSGCNSRKAELKIVCPTGAPAIAFYKEFHNSNFETNGVPSNIIAMMSETSDKDLVAIDTLGGIQAINKGAPYKIAASLTFGNFFIASTGNDANGQMDVGDKIVLFGQNQTPDKLFHYIYGNQYDEGIEYVGNVQDAAKCLISGKNAVTTHSVDYVFVAQPVLLNALAKNTKAAKYANIQDLYKEKSEGKELIQASIFVKNTSSKKNVDKYLTQLEKDIEEAVKNPDVITETFKGEEAEQLVSTYGADPSNFVKAIQDNNSLGLGYKKASSNKENIDAFLSLFSIEKTDEKIYY